jgi:hypothetical protein
MGMFEATLGMPMSTVTTNGMPAVDVTGSKVLDLFYNIGSSRNNPGITSTFYSALGHDPLLSLKCLFWARDVRGGAGERQTFRTIIKELENSHPNYVIANMVNIAEYGRWDDLLIFTRSDVKAAAYKTIYTALMNGNGLCAKWMPRKGNVAVELRNAMKMTPKRYRKLLVGLSNTVEQKLCAQEFTAIEYGKLPSVASARYQAAFQRHDPQGYTAYKDALKDGTQKINANAVFPHDVLRPLFSGKGEVEVVTAQWAALPNYVGDRKILPISDVSGSMTCKASGSLTCLDVSISLGLYLADKNTGSFNGVIGTFHSEPALYKVEGDIAAKVNTITHAAWGGSTNIEKTFQMVLKHATTHNVPAEDMPEAIMILSDMQFDQAHGRYDYVQSQHVADWSPTVIQMIKKQYEDAGYKMPLLVFWNLNAGYGNQPGTAYENGVVMISGFSPAIMKAVLAGDFDNISPESLMLDVLNSQRYSAVVV